jgi:hypothetical protein
MSITHQTMGWHNRGSLWQGVALSADPVTAVPSVVMQRKAKSGTIQPLRTCVAAFGIGVVACGVHQVQISLLINLSLM